MTTRAAGDSPPPPPKGSASQAPVVPSPGGPPGSMLLPEGLVRASAFVAVVASVLGVLVAPGLRGNGTQEVVEAWGRVSSAFALTMALLVGAQAVLGAGAIARHPRVEGSGRAVTLGTTLLVLTLALAAISARLAAPLLVGLGLAASVLAITCARRAARAPHTRIGALVLGAFGVSALTRIGAWELAGAAGERASLGLYAASRGLATAGVVFEALGQLTAVAWLGLRGGSAGRLLSYAATLIAALITWAAARGMHPSAPFWEASLHTALASSSPSPPPFGLGALAVFLSVEGTLLAAVALLVRGELPQVTCALALALVARGGFDVPLRALAAVAAAQGLLLTALDDRALWRALPQREGPKETRAGRAPPPPTR